MESANFEPSTGVTFQPKSEGTSNHSNGMVDILPDNMSDHNTSPTTIQLQSQSTLLQQPISSHSIGDERFTEVKTGESFIEREYPAQPVLLEQPKSSNHMADIKADHKILESCSDNLYVTSRPKQTEVEEQASLKNMENDINSVTYKQNMIVNKAQLDNGNNGLQDLTTFNSEPTKFTKPHDLTHDDTFRIPPLPVITNDNQSTVELSSAPLLMRSCPDVDGEPTVVSDWHEPTPADQTEISPPIKSKTSTDIISEIVHISEKQIFGETSTIQMILNICEKIMKIAGCINFGNEISSLCNQILSETYNNSHVIIDLCQELTNMDVGSPAKTKKGSSKTHSVKAKSKKTVKNSKVVGEVKTESVGTSEFSDWQDFLSSDSEDCLNQDDDPDWTGYWEMKDKKSTSKKEDGESHVKPIKKLKAEDPDWEPEVIQPQKRKKKYKGLKEGCKPTHLKKEAIQCPHCPKLLSQRAYENHQKKHTKISCDICSVTLLAAHLNRHMKVHTGEKPFICEICGSAFACMDSLSGHKLIHSDERPFPCPNCDYRAISNKRLKKHMVTHQTQRKYQCDNCGMRFKRNDDLKRHLLVHKDERPFSCSVCPTRFKKRVSLRRHEQTHTDEYKHQCPVCGKRIRQAGNLKTHMRTHNGEKPYLCDFCGKGFAHNVTRKQHQEVCRRYPQVEVLIQ